jgi:hypothetical protein
VTIVVAILLIVSAHGAVCVCDRMQRNVTKRSKRRVETTIMKRKRNPTKPRATSVTTAKKKKKEKKRGQTSYNNYQLRLEQMRARIELDERLELERRCVRVRAVLLARNFDAFANMRKVRCSFRSDSFV